MKHDTGAGRLCGRSGLGIARGLYGVASLAVWALMVPLSSGCASSTAEPAEAPPVQGAPPPAAPPEPNQTQRVLTQDTNIDGVLYKGGTTVVLNENGKVASGTLAQDTHIQPVEREGAPSAQFFKDGAAQTGLLLKGDTPVLFHKNGQVQEGTLATDIQTDGAIFDTGATLTFDEDGRVEKSCLKASDARVKGIKFQVGSKLCLHANGNVMMGTLGETASIHGTDYAVGTRLWFGENGEVTQAIDGQGNIEIHMPGGQVVYGVEGSESFNDAGVLNKITLSKPLDLEGVKYDSGTRIVLNDEGKVISATITVADEAVQGIPLKPGETVMLHKNGTVAGGELFEDARIRGVTYQGGTEIALYDNGRVKSGTIVNSATIQKIKLKASSEVAFYDNGRLQIGRPSEDAKIKGIRYAGASAEGGAAYMLSPIEEEIETGKKNAGLEACGADPACLEFHENGNVRRGTLARHTKIQGVRFKGGTFIYFYDSGKVHAGTLLGDTILRNATYEARSTVEFYENGDLKRGVLAQPTTIFGVKYAAGPVSFHKGGRIRSATLVRAKRFDNINYKGGSVIEFHANGKVESGVLAAHTLILVPPGHTRFKGAEVSVSKSPGAIFKGGTRVTFYPTGKLHSGTLLANSDLGGGVEFPAGTEVEIEYDE